MTEMFHRQFWVIEIEECKTEDEQWDIINDMFSTRDFKNVDFERRDAEKEEHIV